VTVYDPMPAAPPPLLGQDHALPGPDTYLVLRFNHEGGSPFCTAGQVDSRLHFIREEKMEAERPSRLRNFGVVPWSEALMCRLAEYQQVAGPAWAEYDRVERQAWEDFHRVLAQVETDYERVRAKTEYQRVAGQAWATYQRVASQVWARVSAGLKVLSVDEWEARL
jgi:hypothetical protein